MKQQGSFSLSNNILKDHDGIILEMAKQANEKSGLYKNYYSILSKDRSSKEFKAHEYYFGKSFSWIGWIRPYYQ